MTFPGTTGKRGEAEGTGIKHWMYPEPANGWPARQCFAGAAASGEDVRLANVPFVENEGKYAVSKAATDRFGKDIARRLSKTD